MDSRRTPSSLPLIRLEFFEPFVDELESRGITVSSIVGPSGLSEAALRTSDSLVPANVLYDLVQRAADVANDPFLGAKMGASFDIEGSPLFNLGTRSCASVGDVLINFVRGAEQHASSQTYSLAISGAHARLVGKRTFVPGVRVDQVDAWDVGVWIAVLRHRLAEQWDEDRVLVRMANPLVLPADLLPQRSLVKGDRMGCELQFPSEWLELPASSKRRARRKRGRAAPPSKSLEGALRQALETMKPPAVLTLKQAAKRCGVPPHKLQRGLQESGTSYSALIDEQKRKYAVAAVADSEISFTQIASRLGYSNLANFTRAFRRWTGRSPRAFRGR